jgi:hypothetical protein
MAGLNLVGHQLMKMQTGLAIVASAILLTACGSPISEEAKRKINAPINCSTAKQDIVTLKREKTSVASQAAAGVTSVLPIGLVVGVLSGTAKDKANVATGEYNDMIDAKIAKIKRDCGAK